MITKKEEIIKQINETTLRVEKVLYYNEDLTAEQEDYLLEEALEKIRDEKDREVEREKIRGFENE